MMHKTSLERSQFVVIHDHCSYFYISTVTRKENLCNIMFCSAMTFFSFYNWFESTLESGINVATGNFGKKNKRSPIYTLYIMAFPVVEFSRQGYKIRKVFGKKSTLFK
jgi:hypothetical protein